MNNNLTAALVPGLPHLLKPELSPGYGELHKAMEALGDRWASAGVERILYYSTAWISVLGQLIQAGENLRGLHVDENWHELADLPFDFKVDVAFAKKVKATIESAGYQTKLVNYEGFPVDTGTIVADHLLNKGRFESNMVASCVYTDAADTEALAGLFREELNRDQRKTAVVGIQVLSGRYFTTEIDLREDQISDPGDDRWNRKMIAYLEAGDTAGFEKELPAYCAACKVEMGLKTYHWLKGLGAISGKATCAAYAPVYGTGAAVLSW